MSGLLLAAILFNTGAIESASSCTAYDFLNLADTGRSFIHEGRLVPRPIDVAIWYPLACGGADVSLRQLTADSLVQAGRPTASAPDDVAVAEEAGIDLAAVPAVLDRPSGFIRANDRLPSRPLPLVIYLHPSALEAAPVAARLARLGFAVAAIRWRGTYSQDFDAGPPGLMSELIDAQSVVRDLVDRGVADGKRMHVIGTSFGALTALCLAQADMRIAAIVSHDGGIVSPFGAKMVPKCPWYEDRRPRAALLSLYDARYGELTFQSTAGLKDLREQRLAVPTLRHEDYVGTVELRAAGRPADPVEQERARAYRKMADATAAFIACIQKDREAPCVAKLGDAKS